MTSIEPGILACTIGMVSCLDVGLLIFAGYCPTKILPNSNTLRAEK
jgi:hypothetical protein